MFITEYFVSYYVPLITCLSLIIYLSLNTLSLIICASYYMFITEYFVSYYMFVSYYIFITEYFVSYYMCLYNIAVSVLLAQNHTATNTDDMH